MNPLKKKVLSNMLNLTETIYEESVKISNDSALTGGVSPNEARKHSENLLELFYWQTAFNKSLEKPKK